MLSACLGEWRVWTTPQPGGEHAADQPPRQQDTAWPWQRATVLPQNKDQHRVGVGGVCGAGAWRAQQLLSWRCQGLTELGSGNKRVARGWVSGLCLLVGAVTAIATILIYFFPGSCYCYGTWVYFRCICTCVPCRPAKAGDPGETGTRAFQPRTVPGRGCLADPALLA